MAQFELKIAEIFEPGKEPLPVVIMVIDGQRVATWSTQDARNAGLMLIQAAQGADDEHCMVAALQEVGCNDQMQRVITQLYRTQKANARAALPQGAQEITGGEDSNFERLEGTWFQRQDDKPSEDVSEAAFRLGIDEEALIEN